MEEGGPEHSVRVSAADISRNFGLWQDKALSGPVVVTHRGRDRVVLISAEQYSALRQGIDPAPPEQPDYARAFFNVLTDQLLHSFIMMDEQLRFTHVNPAALAHLGMAREDLIGRTVTAVFPDAVGSAIVDYYYWVLRSGEVLTFEANSPHFPERRLLVRAFPMNGGVGALFANITELHQLRQSRAALQSFSAALSVQPYACQVSLNVRGLMNDAGADFADLTGFTVEELNGKRLVDIFIPRERPILSDAIEKVLNHRSVLHLDVMLLHRNQEVRPVSIGMAPISRDLLPEGIAAIITTRPALPHVHARR